MTFESQAEQVAEDKSQREIEKQKEKEKKNDVQICLPRARDSHTQ